MRRALAGVAVTIALVVLWFGYSRSSPSSSEPDRRDGIEAERALPEGLPDEALPRLMNWLQGDGSPSVGLPSRDIFQKAAQPGAPPPPATIADSPLPLERAPVGIDRPRLTGFVFGGGRVEKPVAAIRYEGRMWLVGVGDQVGPYRVEEMVVGEEAYLVHQESGESLRLTIR